MNLIPGLAWFAALRWHRPERRQTPDLADMGTAFGLDASMAMPPVITSVPPSEGGHLEPVLRSRVWRG